MAGTQHSTSLRTYALTRLALALPMVWILLTLVFLLMRVAPGDPISAALGGRLSPEQLQERREAAGYDRPLALQYFEYLGEVVRLDFGETIVDNRPVTSVILQNGAATLELTFVALLVALVVGISVGLISGRYRDTPVDVAGRLFGIVIYAAPVFFLGFLAQIVFSQWLGWFPSSGRASPVTAFDLDTPTNLFLVDSLIALDFAAFTDVVEHIVLPATTLGLVIGGVFIRLVRVNVLQTLQGDYIEAARARGLPERTVVWHHAFKNAPVPGGARRPALGALGGDRAHPRLRRPRPVRAADLAVRVRRVPDGVGRALRQAAVPVGGPSLRDERARHRRARAGD